MSVTYQRIVTLVRNGEVHVSEHVYDELVEDHLSARAVVASLAGGVVVEDYPDYGKGPCVLVLQRDRDGAPIHVVWGIRQGQSTPAVLVTAYRPDPARWSSDFMRRRK